jgi:hypothetical protein
LLGFLAHTRYAVYLYGYLGFFQRVFANVATTNAFVDLTIALVMVLVWIGQDARLRGTSPLPYLLVTLALGSAGPLIYLIRRFRDKPASDSAPAAHRLDG